jgi:hypothetical protein
MTTTLGGVTLDADMYLPDEFTYNLVNASVNPTIGGGVIVQEFTKVEAGRPLTLLSLPTAGMQKKDTVEALMALAAIPNATYSLVISTTNGGSLSKTVRFRNEVEGGAVQFVPFIEREGLPASDGETSWYKGTLYLMVM